jgi:hypothetical protein
VRARLLTGGCELGFSILSVLEELGEVGGHAFGARLRESIKWFLIDGSDLMRHLEDGDVRGVLYVGRRVEHAWQHLEHFARNWIDAGEAESDNWATEVAALAQWRARLPAIPSQGSAVEAWVGCARDAFSIAGDAVDSLEQDGSVVRVQMRLAREAYSVFRVAKYEWIDLAVSAEELIDFAYQVLDA